MNPSSDLAAFWIKEIACDLNTLVIFRSNIENWALGGEAYIQLLPPFLFSYSTDLLASSSYFIQLLEIVSMQTKQSNFKFGLSSP